MLERCRDTAAVFAYLDMDDFKSINEAYGYDTGDEMLVSFTECLKTLVFDENTVIFRKEGVQSRRNRGSLLRAPPGVQRFPLLFLRSECRPAPDQGGTQHKKDCQQHRWGRGRRSADSAGVPFPGAEGIFVSAGG